MFIQTYYRLSPAVAATLIRIPTATTVTPVLLRPLARYARKWS